MTGASELEAEHHLPRGLKPKTGADDEWDAAWTPGAGGQN